MHTFEKGIIWQPGAGGNFLTTTLLRRTDTYIPHVNEYSVTDSDAYKVRDSIQPLAGQKILNGHQYPQQLLETGTARIDELLIVMPHWFDKLILLTKRHFNYSLIPSEQTWLIEQVMRYPNPSFRLKPGRVWDITRMLQNELGISLTHKVAGEDVAINMVYIFVSWCYYNNAPIDLDHFGLFISDTIMRDTLKYKQDMDEIIPNHVKQIRKLKETGNVGKIMVTNYEDLFFSLNAPWSVGTKELSEYSLKNIALIQHLVQLLPKEDKITWENIMSIQTKKILDQLGK